MSDLHETDVVAWSERQSALLRRVAAGEQVNEHIDWANIIDEVETVGRSERAALQSHIAVVIEHLIKLQASPATEPRNGWKESVLRARSVIEANLEDNPSLRRAVAGMVRDQTVRCRKTVRAVLALYRERSLVEIDSLEFTEDQVLGDWLPDDAG